MSWLWMLPFAAQGGLMSVDELWFHRRRGLPRWERIGHPLDSLSVLVCMSLPWILPLDDGSLRIYALAAALSCLLITKDEAVHSVRCRPAEQWIHACLFVLHPLVLGVVALLWLAREQHPLAYALEEAVGFAMPVPAVATAQLAIQAVLVAGFACYQATYWAYRARRALVP